MLYYDMLYILPALLLTMIASVAVRFTYARYSQVRAGSGITAASTSAICRRSAAPSASRTETAEKRLTSPAIRFCFRRFGASFTPSEGA